ncbi:MAG: penicillin-binding protein 2 [Armatimonadetes bacterium]|nr:penicillin-binding protein 2 [Armatimonadota bacterium]
MATCADTGTITGLRQTLPSSRLEIDVASQTQDFRSRSAIVALFLVGGFMVAGFTQYYLQVYNADEVLKKGKDRQKYTLDETVHSNRGKIYSANGRVLAEDSNTYELSLQVGHGKTPLSHGFFAAVSKATGIPAAEMEAFAFDAAAKVKPEDVKLPIKSWPNPLSQLQADEIDRIRTAWKADGLSTTKSAHRSYPLWDIASAVTGDFEEKLVTKQVNGKTVSVIDVVPQHGLEQGMDNALRGEDGVVRGLVDRHGEFLPMRIDSSSKPKKDGDDLVLTIDTDIQEAAARSLEKAVRDANATSGSAIAIDPKTGDILAMASYPQLGTGQDVNKVKSDERHLGLCPVVEDRFEPGSTMKTLTLALAMDLGLVHDNDEFTCNGELRVSKRNVIHCTSHHGGIEKHGTMHPEMVIAKSCNVTAARWAMMIGHDKYVDFMKRAGLLDRSNIGLAGEVTGKYNTKEYNKTVQVATFGFGQSLRLQPLSLASALTALANDGVRMKPRIVQKVGNRLVEPVSVGPLVKPETAHQVSKYMEAVFTSTSGTGHRLQIEGYHLAGKTGTAERIGKTVSGYVSNFVGFVPSDRPRAVVVVMVNNPKGERHFGAEVAGPVFQDIARSVIKRYDIAPDPALLAQATQKRQLQVDAKDVKTVLAKPTAPAKKAAQVTPRR